MLRNCKVGVGASLLLLAIGYLMYSGIQQSSRYYVTVDEFLARRDRLAGQGLRVAGRVSDGSLWKQTSAAGTEMKFSIHEFTDSEPATALRTVPVEFTGVVPDMFAEGRDVIVEGTYVNGVLHAQTVLTSCPSKYEPGVEAARDDAQAAS